MTIEVESTQVAEIFEKDINKLCEDINAVIEAHNILVDENAKLKNIIKEVRELVENDIDFKCITFRKADEDTWKLILASNIKEDFLEILDKGDDKE